MERSRGWIIEWRAHIYRGLAGRHVTVDGYWGEDWFVITFGVRVRVRVREKRMMSRILRVVNDVIGNGHLEHVLQLDFWGRIRVGSVYRGYVGLDWELRIVKGVMIVGLYRERH